MKIARYAAFFASSLGAMLVASPAHAGTAAYYAECSFIDRGPDSGGDVLQMPCYIVEGANVRSAFFHILWQDGTYTLRSGNAETGESTGSFRSLVHHQLYENPEGDLISIGELEYTNDRFNVTEEGIADRVW